MVKKNTIPDGWRNVQPVGQPIPGTRFIAFKVPLKGVINHRLTPTQKFTPKDLIAAMKMLNVELGLIIDLTYTTRYYDVKDLPKSLEYKKLFTVGHEVPDDATILQFKKWVRKFLWENADNEKLIGVHCTNGINRTGYLICRYLIDVEGWEPGTAIQGACWLLELNPRFCMLASVALVGIEIPSSRNATCEGGFLNLLSVVLRHPRKSCF